MVTQERLKELVRYDPLTGLFRWAVSPHPRYKVGDVVGCLDTNGYRVAKIDGTKYGLHRLAFLYMRGYMPIKVDHEDTDKANNAWSNLRPATSAQNQYNKGIQANNTSGVKGVSFDAARGKWVASVRTPIGRLRRRFASLSEATQFVSAVRTQHHGAFARTE